MNFKTGFILSVFFFGLNAFGQELPKKLKYDKLVYSVDSTYVAVIGKKSGIYNLKKAEFAVPPEKGQMVIHSPVFNIFTVFNSGGSKSYEAFNPEILKELEVYNTMVGGAHFNVSDLSDGRFLIRDVEYEMTGLSNDGLLMFNYEKPFEGSGVYNLDTRVWEVPRKYSDIFIIQNTLFALKHDETEFEFVNDIKKMPAFVGNYDIYTLDTKGQWLLQKENVKTVDEVPFKEMFGYQSIDAVEDIPFHYRGKKLNGKEDYFVMNLFTDGIFWSPELKFELVSQDIEFAAVNTDEHVIVTYAARDSFPIKLFGYLNEKKPTEDKYVHLLEKGSKNVRYGSNNFETFDIYGDTASRMLSTLNFNEGIQKMNFGILKLNDDLIKVYNSGFNKFRQLKSIRFPIEDSLNIDGNVVFESTGSTSATGIYNISTGQWLVDPYQYDCYAGKDYILLGYLETPDESESLFRVKYDLYDMDENMLLSGVEIDTILHSPKVLRDIMWDLNADTMFYTGFDINHLSSPIYYYRSNDKIGVVEFYDLMLNDYYSTPLADFAYFNSPVNFTFLLENEQIQLHLRDTVYKVSDKGKISLNFNHQPSVSDGSFIRIECIDIGDTTIFEFNDYMSYSGNVRASLTIDNHGKLVLVDSTAFYLELESPDNYEGFFSARFGDEKSTIWQKGNNGWMICSPYYNFIEPVANGYICKTGFLYNDQVSPDEDYNVDPRFIILDARLKPVSMLDFYDFESVEDLGFGLKVCTDKGCMFVTYDYQPVTNDEWTDFKLTPDGRLMAIGKIVQHKGTDGNPFDPQIADGIVSYFEIPKK